MLAQRLANPLGFLVAPRSQVVFSLCQQLVPPHFGNVQSGQHGGPGGLVAGARRLEPVSSPLLESEQQRPSGNVVATLCQAAAPEESRQVRDGAMIGRGIFDNPWLFSREQRERSREEKLSLLWRHTELFDRVWGDHKNFHILRRYYSIYAKGFHGAAELRAKLMQTENIREVRMVLNTAAG